MPLRIVIALAVVVLLAILLIGGVVGLRVRRTLESQASSRRARRGLRGEKRAEQLLTRHGYRVIDRQVRGSYDAEIDGQPTQVSLSADLLVQRRGQTWIAEVKTGPEAPRFEHADTRRQLLEYQLAFGGSAVLLVDPERETIREVRFPLTSSANPTESSASFAAGLLIALGIAGALLWFGMR